MPPPSKDTPSLSSSRSTRSTASFRPTPPPSPERARALSGSSSPSTSSSREIKTPGVDATPDFDFHRQKCGSQSSRRGEAREEGAGPGPEIVEEPAPPALAVDVEEEEAEVGREAAPTFKQTMAKLQTFGKGRISVVWLKGTMAVIQVNG